MSSGSGWAPTRPSLDQFPPNQNHLSCTHPSQRPRALAREPLNQHWATDHRERWAAVPIPPSHHLSPVIVVTHQQSSVSWLQTVNRAAAGLMEQIHCVCVCVWGELLLLKVCLGLVSCLDPDSNPLYCRWRLCSPRGEKKTKSQWWMQHLYLWGEEVWRPQRRKKGKCLSLSRKEWQYDSLFGPVSMIKSFSRFEVVPLIHFHIELDVMW